MKITYAVTWREPDGERYAGSLQFGAGAFVLEQRSNGRGGVRRTVAYDDVRALRVDRDTAGRPTLLVGVSGGDIVIASNAVNAGIVQQLAQRMPKVRQHPPRQAGPAPDGTLRRLERVAITARLTEGAEARARELVAAGPPFDLGRAGLTEHGVYVGHEIVVFVFEGSDVTQRLSHVLNDRLNAAAFGAWAPLLAEPPRLAHEGYHWNAKEDTMQKILIATDGSESAHEALEFGFELAKEQGGTPFVVYVAPPIDVLPGAGFAVPAPTVPHVLDERDQAPLQEAVRLAAQEGLDAKTELLAGHPAEEIVAFADAIDADLIVVGSRGQGGIASALLGSVSRAVLHESRRPVLVVRGAHIAAEAAVNS